MDAIRSDPICRRQNATSVTSTFLLSLRVSIALKYHYYFPIHRLKTLRPSAMKTAFICLAAGFGLAHVTPFLARADASRVEAPSAVRGNSADSARPGDVTPLAAFSQYEVPAPTTMTLASSEDSSLTGAPVHALAADGVAQVVAATSTLSPVHPDIASNVARGVSQMDEAMKTAPLAMARMSESVAKNGIIAALAYDDPAVKAQTAKLSAQLGDSLRNFAEAIGKDMQRSVRESGIQAQSVSGR
jgi:hypothetical protein